MAIDAALAFKKNLALNAILTLAQFRGLDISLPQSVTHVADTLHKTYRKRRTNFEHIRFDKARFSVECQACRGQARNRDVHLRWATYEAANRTEFFGNAVTKTRKHAGFAVSVEKCGISTLPSLLG